MAINPELGTALKKAAVSLIKRDLNEIEDKKLIEAFDKAAGTNYERALEALTEITNFSRVELLQKSASSDNADRAMRDLKDKSTSWKPGT